MNRRLAFIGLAIGAALLLNSKPDLPVLEPIAVEPSPIIETPVEPIGSDEPTEDTEAAEPEPPVIETPPIYQSAPRGHYEYRRTGLFRRKKVWVAE